MHGWIPLLGQNWKWILPLPQLYYAGYIYKLLLLTKGKHRGHCSYFKG
jgi:hypothetical protein